MRRSRRMLAGALLATVVVVAGACSGGGGSEAKKSQRTTTTTTPEECVIKGSTVAGDGGGAEGGDAAVTTTSIVQTCLDKAFTQAVADKGSAALKKIPQDQVLGFGHGLCAYASVIAEDPTKASSYEELVKSTTASWQVKTATFEEVLGFAATLCPDQLRSILDLRAAKGGGAVELMLGATGTAPMDVTYLSPDGTTIDDQVPSPWTHAVPLAAATDFSFTVRATEGDVECTVTIKDKQVKSAKGTKDAPADCSVTTAEIRDAN